MDYIHFSVVKGGKAITSTGRNRARVRVGDFMGGFLRLQSWWSLSCDHGLDYGDDKPM